MAGSCQRFQAVGAAHAAALSTCGPGQAGGYSAWRVEGERPTIKCQTLPSDWTFVSLFVLIMPPSRHRSRIRLHSL